MPRRMRAFTVPSGSSQFLCDLVLRQTAEKRHLDGLALLVGKLEYGVANQIRFFSRANKPARPNPSPLCTAPAPRCSLTDGFLFDLVLETMPALGTAQTVDGLVAG